MEDKKIKIKFNVFAIICILIFSIALTPITLQNDTFYTIKIGEHIINNGIDMQDPFSWHEDLAYTYPHWAYDTGTYLIYQLGELTGIQEGGMLFIYIATVILSCILGIMMYISCSKITKNNLLSFFSTMFAMYLIKDYIAARAQLVTFILFILTILFIESFIEKNKKRYLVGLVIISIIIANVHVAVWPFFFVLFMPYVVEYIIACLKEQKIILRLYKILVNSSIKSYTKKIEKEQNEEQKQILNSKLEKYKNKIILIEQKLTEKSIKENEKAYKIQVEKHSNVKWLILVMIICILAGLLTPLGDTPYTYLLKTMQGNTTKNISEHQPLVLYKNVQVMVMLGVFLIILIFTDTKIKLRDCFMLFGLIFLSFMSARQVSMLILIGVFIFTKFIDYLANKYDEDGCKYAIILINTILGRILILSCVLLVCFCFIKNRKNDNFINEKKYPVEAANWILENLDVENIHLYNEYNYGSYLLYRGIPVFIDSRADLYAPEFNIRDGEEKGRDIFTDYINISSIGTYYEPKFKEYGITHAIVINNAKLNIFLSRDSNYVQLYSDKYFTVYERKTK